MTLGSQFAAGYRMRGWRRARTRRTGGDFGMRRGSRGCWCHDEVDGRGVRCGTGQLSGWCKSVCDELRGERRDRACVWDMARSAYTFFAVAFQSVELLSVILQLALEGFQPISRFLGFCGI